jgi:hypothetical protein
MFLARGFGSAGNKQSVDLWKNNTKTKITNSSAIFESEERRSLSDP